MPSSRCNHVPTIISVIRRLKPASILDIGVGFGKWGHLFREYTDIVASEKDPPRYRRENWRVTIDGIEGFADYLTPAHAYFYNSIFIGDMRQKIREVGQYDVVFLGDVIEHVDKDDGFRLLQDCLAHANMAVLISTPGSSVEQAAICDNELEIHRGFWSAADFKRFPLGVTALVENDILVAMLGKPGVTLPPLRPDSRKRPAPESRLGKLKRPLRPLKPLLSRVGLLARPKAAPAVNPRQFRDSTSYWEERYRGGGNSGAGSYGHLAEYKAQFLNAFIADRNVETVVEFGCGDGNQLSLLHVSRYCGVDVSRTIFDTVRKRFSEDRTKSFVWSLDPAATIPVCDLAMSLDVIYHLVEDEAFEKYMDDLFGHATRYVVVYSSNVDAPQPRPHVRDRRFTTYVEAHWPSWRMLLHEPNPFRSDTRADFYVFERQESPGSAVNG